MAHSTSIVIMPGTERVELNVSRRVRQRMEDTELSEDQLFAFRPEEGPYISQGRVHMLESVEKERILDYLQEVLRLRVEVGAVVSHIRGDPYVRAAMSRGEDFIFVAVEPNEQLGRSPSAYLLQHLARHLETRFAISLKPADLSLEIPSGESLPAAYTLLDIVFVAATSRSRSDNFADQYKILRLTLDYRPRVTPLGPAGQNLL